LLSALFVGMGIVLTVHLGQVQIAHHDRYAELARDERLQELKIPARRGALLDTNGFPLATSVGYDSLQIVGQYLADPEKTVQALAPLLEMPPEELRAKIDPTSNRLVPVKSGLSSAVSAQVRALDLYGVRLIPEPHRLYPEGSIAAEVLGFVGTDRKGLAGLEFNFEDVLAGEPGVILSERDTEGLEIATGERALIPAKQGKDLVLTLDRVVQRLAERTLSEAVTANRASGGLILVMEPATGAILGMASLPTFSLTGDQADADQETSYKTVQVTNQYEPGSVMKVITMAAGLEDKLVTPSSTVNDGGQIEVGGFVLKNWDFRANGVISMTEVLVRSSNVGAQYVSGLLGPDRFYQYIDAFGFGQLTGVELPGEVPGTVRTPVDTGWARVDLATNSYGQGIAVTPLQMLTAVSAIANSGVVMKPQIVRAIRSGDQVEPVPPQPVRQAISPTTAKALTEMMVEVLEQSALIPAQLPGYRFAAKTGTADLPTSLGYKSGKTYASVAAFGPLPDTRFSILIRLDAPEAIYGGAVAGPVLKRMTQELVAYYRLPASTTPAAGRVQGRPR
jgi:cell division protein FtsI/penicillin-binding protein 2